MNIPGVVSVKTPSVRHEPRQVEITEEPVVKVTHVEFEVSKVATVAAPVRKTGLAVYGQKYAEDGLTLDWRPR
jgi:hypothetical protein